jgi:hypothetical protein
MPQPSNLILEIQSADVSLLFQQLLDARVPFPNILDALFARFSNMSLEELFRYLEASNLVSSLQILNDLLDSMSIYDMDIESTIREIFGNFSDQIAGRHHLFAVLALVQLIQVPTNEVTSEQDKKIEALKLLFLSTIFNDGVVLHFMDIRDYYEQRAMRCPCPNCNANFIFAIGWYVAAQNAHNGNAFVANEG